MPRLIAFQADDDLQDEIQRCADKLYDGNISMLIRMALKEFLEAN